MSNSLTIGSERLVKANNNMRLTADDIKADPGIKALVSLAELVRDGKAARVDGDATLDKWETGK